MIPAVKKDLKPSQAERQLQFNEWMENKDQYVILDTETTGLYNAEICDVAVIDLDGNTLFNTLVKTKNPIPQDATNIHGITDEMVQDAPTWLEVWDKLYPILKEKTLLIYNSQFDVRVLCESFHPYGLPYEDERIQYIEKKLWAKSQCVMKAYADYIYSPRWVKLSVACGYTTKHRALDDCLATLDVIRKVYDPTFTEVDFKRSQLRYKYYDLGGDIERCMDELKEISEKMEYFYKQREEITKTLVLSDDEILAIIEAEKAEQEVAAAKRMNDPFNEEGKPIDLSDSDLPF